MGYSCGMSKGMTKLAQALYSAEDILPAGDTIYRGTLQHLKPYRAMNIFSNDTNGNDPALVEATNDFYKSHAKLTSQLLEDGLTPVGLPRDVRAEDLGESLAVIPTKYGVPAVVPVGTTNALYNPDSDAIVVNKRIIYGTKEQKESTNIYKRALDFVEKHAPEGVKNKLKTFYKSKLYTLESKAKSREKLTETSVHELFHKKQEDAGILGYFVGKYGRVTDYVRNIVERHCIRYTSRLFNKRTGEGTYGVLENQAIEGERKKGVGPHHIIRKSELHGPEEAGRLAETVYGLEHQFEF